MAVNVETDCVARPMRIRCIYDTICIITPSRQTRQKCSGSEMGNRGAPSRGATCYWSGAPLLRNPRGGASTSTGGYKVDMVHGCNAPDPRGRTVLTDYTSTNFPIYTYVKITG